MGFDANQYAVYDWSGDMVGGPFRSEEEAQAWINEHPVFDLYDHNEECVEWAFASHAAALQHAQQIGLVGAEVRQRPASSFDVMPYFEHLDPKHQPAEEPVGNATNDLSPMRAPDAETPDLTIDPTDGEGPTVSEPPAANPVNRTAPRSSRVQRECAVCGTELAARQKTFCSRHCHMVYLETFGPWANDPERVGGVAWDDDDWDDDL